ncbi:TonB family protein [Lysobacter sp. Root494]|uniref:TonB family protein n=1 Tax=Lysobacter sp. Root494 TaxID=1736549 RepID=UPI000B33E22F|nr:TonB family protein [Lysobacter sp. Root494]
MWKSAFFLIASSASSFAFAADDGAKAVFFTARVSVAADGHATVSDLVGPKGALAQVVVSRLAKIRFVPARRNGMPVAAEAPLHGRIVLTPVGTDDFDVSVRDVTTRPVWEKAQPPNYPPDRIRVGQPGAVEMRVRIDAQGRVSDAVMLSSTDASFEHAVRRVATQWRFAPQLVETTVVVPVVFRDQSKAAAAFKPQFLCLPDETRPNVEGDTGCTDRLEVFGARVRREVTI